MRLTCYYLKYFQGKGGGVQQGQADLEVRADPRLRHPLPERCQSLVAEAGGAGHQQGEDYASARPQDEGKEKAFDHSGCFKAVRPGASFSRFCSLKRNRNTAF